jgi:hypothetical protein
MNDIPPDLLRLIDRKAAQPVAPSVHALAQSLRATYGAALQAILFYGSCLRSGEDRGGMVDLYAVVDRYRGAYRSGLLASLNTLLPPNVFYLEVPFEGRVVRAKYAVLSLADLERGTSPRWFHSYLWGRFCQPTAVLYVACGVVSERVQRALGRAVLTFLDRTVPCLPARFSARELWLEGLSLSYRAELRAERPEKLAGLYEPSAEYYRQITEAALAGLSWEVAPVGGNRSGVYRAELPQRARMIGGVEWAARRLQGKLLHLLRLLKGAYTFTGGLDYILWKIERHAGVTVAVPPRLRRHPLLAVCVVSWRLYRRGAFR